MKKLVLALILLSGCTSPFYKAVDGTSTILGVSLPDEQYIQINALSYLGGSKTIVREPACIERTFKSASTNSYFGVITTHELRTDKIRISLTNCCSNAAK